MLKRRLFLLIVTVVALSCMSASVAAQDTENFPWAYRGEYPIADELTTLRVMVVQPTRVEDLETNAFTQWLEELTNVHVEWEIVPSEGASEALSLTMASGDLPDVILSFNINLSALSIYGSQGLIIPLNDLIDEYGVNTQWVLEEVPGLREEITAADGNIYGLPYVNVCYHCSGSQKLWIYQPWLDALGLDMPQTTEDLRDVLRAFRDEDPNGNGIQDEIPLAGATNGWHTQLRSYLINPFILENPFYDNAHLYLDNGQVRANFVTDEYREALRYISSLYDEGLIAPESLTQTTSELLQLGENPDVPVLGAVPAGYAGIFTQIGGESGRWDDYVTVPPLEGPDGNRITPWEPYLFAAGSFMITRDAADPITAFRWGDAFYEWEITHRRVYGVQGENWDYAPQGIIGLNGEQACRIMLTPYGEFTNNHWYETGPEYLSAQFRLCEGYEEMTGGLLSERILYDETANNYAPNAAPPEMMVPRLVLSEDASAESIELWTGINAYADEMFGLFITGQADLDAEWDTYVQTLNDLGLPRYLELRQEAFDNQWAGRWPPAE